MQPTSFTCSRCSAPLPPGVTQCPSCGQTFAAPVPASGAAPYAAGTYTAPPPKKKGLPAVAIVAIAAIGCLPMIAIVAAILFPVFAQAREKAREISSMSNMKQIGLATSQFANDHDERLPPMDTMDHFKAALTPYLKSDPNHPLFEEPGANQPYILDPEMSNRPLASIKDPVNTGLMTEPVPHIGGRRAVLYADGHVALTGGRPE